MKAIVLSFDSLHLGSLGFYGGLWAETPHWNRLATESTVFDRHFGEDFDSNAHDHAWWTGCHHFPPTAGPATHGSWIEQLCAAGVSMRLVIEAGSTLPGVGRHFPEGVAALRSSGSSEGECRQSWLKSALQEIGTFGSRPDEHELLWLHARGVSRQSLDDNDTTEAKTSDSADVELADDVTSSDQTRELRRQDDVRAASDFDQDFGRLWKGLQPVLTAGNCLLVVTAAAGAPLHNPRTAESAMGTLDDELVHSPHLIRLPDSAHATGRCDALVQTIDLAPTLLEWFELAVPSSAFAGVSLLPLVRGTCQSVRETAFLGSSREWGIRNQEYFYVISDPANASAEHPAGRLYLKPNDRWDTDDVGRHYLDVVAELDQRLREFVAPGQLQTEQSGLVRSLH